MTSKRIMLINEYNDLKIYRAQCACGETEHDIILEFEDNNTIRFNLNMISYPNNESFFKKFYSKIKMCYYILFKGLLTSSHEFILDDKDQIDDFISIFIDYFKK